MSLKELRERAKELQILNYYKLNKSQLISEINEYVHPLLYCLPKNGVSSPIDDELTEKLEMIFNTCPTTGVYNGRGKILPGHFMGIHQCRCGEYSENRDYLLTAHYATNSLCVHYMRDHRAEVPKEELEKLVKMFEEFDSKNE